MSAGMLSTAEYWATRYRDDQTGWDLGAATAVFQDALARNLLPFPDGGEKKVHVLVPGCGKGHDAEIFARHGYRVTALDFAGEALEQLRERINGDDLDITTLQRDIFTVKAADIAPVDLILEYTMYCAIEPQRRPEYAAILAALMKTGATLAAINFPLEFPTPGPPFKIDPAEFSADFEAAGLRVIHRETPRASHPARAGNEYFQILQKTDGDGR